MHSRAYYLTTLGEWKRHVARFASSHWCGADPAAPAEDASHIFVLVEGDEGVHAALEQHDGFDALPHPLSHRPVPARIAEKLAAHGIAAGATTFDVAEMVGREHPLLRHRVF
jgi:hypothetical protein